MKKQKSDKDAKTGFLSKKSILFFIIPFFVFTVVASLIFFFAYNGYSDQILYQERLSQMKEVTGQLFNGLEDVIENQWYHADVQKNRIVSQQLSTVEELQTFLKNQAEISSFDKYDTELIVVTKGGRYYSQKNDGGFIASDEYIDGTYSKISFVMSTATQDVTRMYFLEKLEQPIVLTDDGGQTITLTYAGLARDMKELNQYFTCDAYSGKNAVYVLDDVGTTLFSGSNSKEYLNGFNVFKQLEDITYLHGSDFKTVKKELGEKGLSYSNAKIGDMECYYSLYRMANSDWTLLFIVPSDVVAVNTVNLVNSSMIIVFVFALLMFILASFFIYFVIHAQQKKAVLALEDSNRQLEDANEELAKAQQQTKDALLVAKNASKAKTEFLSNMSHDIRTPMNAIVGLTKLMEHDVDNPAQMKIYFSKLESSSQHLLSLINDVLDMSRIESSKVILNREPVNLAEQVGEVDSILRPQARERYQTFTIMVHEIVHENLLGDALRFRQILINLLTTAIKYTQNGGNISLDFTEKPGNDDTHETLEIEVKDNGRGMSKEFLDKIFEPFTREESSLTNRIQGTGLGMTITRNVVHLMGGTISVESELGKGTCFHVSLPVEIDTGAKIELPLDNVLLVAEDENLIKNAKACFTLSGVKLDIVSGIDELKAFLDLHSPEAILLSGYIESPKLPDMVSLLHEKAKNALLVFCVDYTQQQMTSDFLKRTGLNGLISRPFFLTNFAHFVQQIRHEHSTKENGEGHSVLYGKRFLCAEDNALNAEILKALLDMSGAHCTVYENGKEIVEAFENVKPGEYDAILMDVQMPVMNGLEATKLIRGSKNPLGKSIPIIAMTANVFSSDVKDCLDAGMNAHLPKPIEISALERMIRNLENSGGGSFRRIEKN